MTATNHDAREGQWQDMRSKLVTNPIQEQQRTSPEEVVLKAGFMLLRQRRYCKTNWLLRYFVLRHGKLQSYTSPSEYRSNSSTGAVHIIYLNTLCGIQQKLKNQGSVSAFPICQISLQMRCGKRWVLRAVNVENWNSWIKALSAAVTHKRTFLSVVYAPKKREAQGQEQPIHRVVEEESEKSIESRTNSEDDSDSTAITDTSEASITVKGSISNEKDSFGDQDSCKFDKDNFGQFQFGSVTTLDTTAAANDDVAVFSSSDSSISVKSYNNSSNKNWSMKNLAPLNCELEELQYWSLSSSDDDDQYFTAAETVLELQKTLPIPNFSFKASGNNFSTSDESITDSSLEIIPDQAKENLSVCSLYNNNNNKSLSSSMVLLWNGSVTTTTSEVSSCVNENLDPFVAETLNQMENNRAQEMQEARSLDKFLQDHTTRSLSTGNVSSMEVHKDILQDELTTKEFEAKWKSCELPGKMQVLRLETQRVTYNAQRPRTFSN